MTRAIGLYIAFSEMELPRKTITAGATAGNRRLLGRPSYGTF